MVSSSGKRAASPRLGRPAASQAALRTSRLLDAATQTFLQHGFAGASMSEIARRAGASKHTLYARYPTKSALFAALMERKSEQIFGAITPLNPELPMRDVLLRFGCEVLGMILTREAQELHRLVIAECLEFPELGQTFWRVGPGRAHALLGNYLRQQQERGATNFQNLQRAVEVWFGLLLGATTMRPNLGMASFVRTRAEQAAWADFVVDLFLRMR